MRRLALALCALGLALGIPSPAGAVPAVYSSGSTGCVSIAAVTSWTFNYTVPAVGLNTAVYVMTWESVAVTPTATFGGAAMTFVGNGGIGGLLANSFLFRLKAPTPGVNAVVFTFGGPTTATVTATTVTVAGVDQVTPEGTLVQTNSGVGVTFTENVLATSANNRNVDFINLTDNAPKTFAPGAGQGALQLLECPGVPAQVGSSQAPGTQGTFTWTAGASQTWGSLGVPIRGGPTFPNGLVGPAGCGGFLPLTMVGC